MGFFFSKENREQRAKEREQLRKEKEERKERVEQQKKEYCLWYTKETQRFINELKEKNFNPTWGFEVEPYFDTFRGMGKAIWRCLDI